MVSECNQDLRKAGKAYPRTCSQCGLGPCTQYQGEMSEQQTEKSRKEFETKFGKEPTTEGVGPQRFDRFNTWHDKLCGWNEGWQAGREELEKENTRLRKDAQLVIQRLLNAVDTYFTPGSVQTSQEFSDSFASPCRHARELVKALGGEG